MHESHLDAAAAVTSDIDAFVSGAVGALGTAAALASRDLRPLFTTESSAFVSGR